MTTTLPKKMMKKKTDKQILDETRRGLLRQLEIEVQQYADALETNGLTKEQIETQIGKYRQKLTKQLQQGEFLPEKLKEERSGRNAVEKENWSNAERSEIVLEKEKRNSSERSGRELERKRRNLSDSSSRSRSRSREAKRRRKGSDEERKKRERKVKH